MIEIIREIFVASHYQETNCIYGSIYSLLDEQKKSFWLVVSEENIDLFTARQSFYFDECKRKIADRALDKNLNLLILHEANNHTNAEFKQKILQIEEDAYFFKKHVLYFSRSEFESFKESTPIINMPFLEKEISSKSSFSEYKKSLNEGTWQNLLYRIAIKLPFIGLNLGFADSLEDLESKNQHSLYNAKKASFSNDFFVIVATTSPLEIKNSNALEILNSLSPLLEE